ncbi:hypothetical protein A2U01_0100345, partial [Trifolium medium]|nr:hypothetical protein [Trifolium medium]
MEDSQCLVEQRKIAFLP